MATETFITSDGQAILVDYLLDMGDMPCKQLLLKVATAMQDVASGQIMLVIASDPAAPVDIGAWCRTTGNKLVHMSLANNQFFIRKGQ